jgi:hypothetical protein
MLLARCGISRGTAACVACYLGNCLELWVVLENAWIGVHGRLDLHCHRRSLGERRRSIGVQVERAMALLLSHTASAI